MVGLAEKEGKQNVSAHVSANNVSATKRPPSITYSTIYDPFNDLSIFKVQDIQIEYFTYYAIDIYFIS